MFKATKYITMPNEYSSRELLVLNYIDQHAEATQRELSQHVGMSLGAINLLLKRFIKKGFVKVERLQPNSVKYFLTPAGLANKIERTYGYMVRTFTEINRLRNRVVTVANAVAQSNNADHLYFFGTQDELHELIHDLIRTDRFIVRATLCSSVAVLKKDSQQLNGNPVIIWNKDMEERLREAGIEWVNVMGMV
jgi:DNA-binding MarR family transcriptional regulator